MSNIVEESDSQYEWFYTDDYAEQENRIAQQEKEDWENREQYGIEW